MVKEEERTERREGRQKYGNHYSKEKEEMIKVPSRADVTLIEHCFDILTGRKEGRKKEK